MIKIILQFKLQRGIFHLVLLHYVKLKYSHGVKCFLTKVRNFFFFFFNKASQKPFDGMSAKLEEYWDVKASAISQLNISIVIFI